MKSIHEIYFSPTGTTQKIVNTIASQLKSDRNTDHDMTHDNLNSQFTSSDMVIIGAPVYAGRIPEIVTKRIEKLSGDNTAAIVIVVYGNREYEDALLELSNLMTGKGFKVLSAAAFIGEHSFSNNTFPIAVNRPDDKDLLKASEYGSDLSRIVTEGLKDHFDLTIPGNFPYKKKKTSHPISPVTNDNCTNCFSCIEACPTNAIKNDDPFISNPERCIKCCACIKACEYGARSFENEGILNMAKKLFENCRERKEPELFFFS